MTSGEYNPDLGWLMHDKYRRDGMPYPKTQEGLLEWTRDYGDHANRIVRQDTLPNGYFVSTVWLGLDHGWGKGLPLIFETMVFPPDSRQDEYCERYATEAEEIIGHRHAVDLYST
jgi:hypothetical protein